MKRLVGRAAVCAAICALAAGCGRNGGGRPAPGGVGGILLVTLSEAPATPDDAAAMGLSPIRFRPVSAELLPSAASALTGLLPPEHGLRVDGVGALGAGVATLASTLAARGYDCAAFVSDAALSPGHCLTNGFSVYSVVAAPDAPASRFRGSSSATCAAAADWLSSRENPSRRPVFVWIHLSPLGGKAPTWEAPAPKTGARADGAAGLAEIVSLFDDGSSVAIVPLYEAAPETDPDGAPGRRSFDVPGSEDVPADSPGFVRGTRDASGAVSVADVPWLLGLAGEKRPTYWESLVPWYAFRLPPLSLAGEGAPSPLDGLRGPPRPEFLGFQAEMGALRAAGHVGEGLVPPLPPDCLPLDGISADGAARLERWRAAAAAEDRVGAARALAASDPGVPLFSEMLGAALLSENDLSGACNAFAAASSDGYNMVRANRLLSRCHAALGNVPAAIDRAEAAFMAGETDPIPRRELARLLLGTGVAMAEAGELKSARDCFDRVSLLEPENPAGKFENAKVDLRLGDTNSAVRQLRAMVRDPRGFPPAAELLSELESGGRKPAAGI